MRGPDRGPGERRQPPPRLRPGAPAGGPGRARRSRPGATEALRYIAFHKPYGVLCQFTGAEGERTLSAFGLPKGVYPVGRLDRDSEGLLLLSNDGRFIARLLNPRNAHERTYLVQVEGVPDAAALAALCGGMDLKGERFRPCRAERLEAEPELPPRDPPIRERKLIPTAWLTLTLTEGKNRQVRRMTAAVGFPTLRLVRVAIGRLRLDGLPQGAWREVAPGDILE